MSKAHSVPCHQAALEAAQAIVRRSGRNEFSIPDVIREVHSMGHRFADSTIRTEVLSRCCRNAPENHAVTYDYFERIDRAKYRLVN